jgi:uncharacterized membrane protein YfhO
LTGLPVYVYRNELVAPRVFSPASIETFETHDQLYKALYSRAISSLLQTALVTAGDLPSGTMVEAPAKIVAVANEGTDVLRISVEAPGRALIVVTNTYVPFWTAFVNGARTRVIPVYHAFQGVPVAAGHSTVELRYNPRYVPSSPRE